jgi:DNA repair exonuclease SbcCD nuclease subunit
MNKIAIIGDSHYGIRGDSQIVLNYQNKFFNNIFFPELKKRKIQHIIHLGDLVDKRTTINFNTVKRLREDFLDKIIANKLTMDIIIGNHDTYFKSTNSLNAFDTILGDYRNNIKTYIDPAETDYGLFIPWINSENHQRSIDAITNSNSALCYGHLEIAGFEMLRGIVCDHGIDMALLSNFEYVFTGHFHHKSSNQNIHYLGAPYQMTWNDYDSSKGFHIFDYETRELEFIENPYQLFIRLIYKGTDIDVDISNSYCKVVVKERGDPYLFDKFIQSLEQQQPADLKIVEPLAQETNEFIIGQAEDTQTIVAKHIEQLDIQEPQKIKLKQLINTLYNDAIEIERNI